MSDVDPFAGLAGYYYTFARPVRREQPSPCQCTIHYLPATLDLAALTACIATALAETGMHSEKLARRILVEFGGQMVPKGE